MMSNKLHGIAGVIIDLDGTMLDTAPDLQLAINRMRAELQLSPLTLEMVKDFVGQGTENLIHRVLAVDFEPEEANAHFAFALASYLRHYHTINGSLSIMYPGVKEGLIALQQKGLRLACVTNKPAALAIPLLKKTALHDYFDVIYGGDCLPKKKPDPYPLLQVCRDFGLQPQHVLAIGDSSNDARAARAAGCWVWSVPYGYNHGSPVEDIDSDGIVATLLDAAQHIESLQQQRPKHSIL